jgi:hypothetical protein
MDALQTSPKLPVMPTLLSAWKSVPRNFGLAMRLYWPWLAIAAVTVAAWIAAVAINAGTSTPSNTLVGGAGLVPILVLLIALLIGAPAVFVGWHRGIQSGARPNQPIEIDSAVMSYLGYSLLIAVILGLMVGLVVLIVTVVAGITTGLGEGPMSLERLVALRPFLPLAIIPFYLLLSRFSLVLPAIAIGRPMTLADSFRLTRGNTWRLTVGAGLVYIPVVLLSGIAEILGIAFPGSMGLLASVSILVLAVSLYCMHAALSFATFALQHLGPREAI